MILPCLNFGTLTYYVIKKVVLSKKLTVPLSLNVCAHGDLAGYRYGLKWAFGNRAIGAVITVSSGAIAQVGWTGYRLYDKSCRLFCDLYQSEKLTMIVKIATVLTGCIS